MKNFFFIVGRFFSILTVPFLFLFKKMKSVKMYMYTGFYSNCFASFGKGSLIIPTFRMIVGSKYISIGSNCIVGKQVQLTAYDHYNGVSFQPSISLGDGSNIGDYSHITSINKIEVGKGVLMGRNILITDNSHGGGDDFTSQLCMPVKKRPIISKGGVFIGDNVWIGEKASIIGNVTIGKGSIIGANTVITKNIPEYTLAVGNPIRLKPLIK